MDWKEIANFGVVFLCLAGLAFAVWMTWRAIGNWLKSKLDPIADAHLQLIRTLQEHAPKQTAAMQSQAKALEEISTSNHEQQAMLLRINSNTEQAVKVENECVKGIVTLSDELQKQTVELLKQTKQGKDQADSLELHRKELERILAAKLPANSKGGEDKT